ncbi:unnamed protein product [Rotaria sordida]|uniref:FAD dependent oxidoreductase domain-containing protein n=1 Tax=Rotaria sordida TaxID=392033 RepID=A0A815DKU3_9BILA|nr:unnamed protein product [Rotaria sordida]CAF1298712.1 unnamed protein product [Rotaria sordida]
MSSITIEISRYLSPLQCYLLQDSQVKFIKRKIYSLIELKDKADIVINCTGLASRDLVGDLTIIQVHAAWKKSVYEFDTDDGFGYIIPHFNSVVLGGTFQVNNWNTIIDENDTKNVLCICSKCLPAPEHIRHGKVQVGLRLYRDDGVCREHEKKTADGINVVHCYDHSGSDIVKTLLPSAPKEQNSENNNLPEHEQLWRLTLNFEYVNPSFATDSSSKSGYSYTTIEQILQYSLCLDRFHNPRALSFQHIYCYSYLKRIISSNILCSIITCSICRHIFPYDNSIQFSKSYIHNQLFDLVLINYNIKEKYVEC